MKASSWVLGILPRPVPPGGSVSKKKWNRFFFVPRLFHIGGKVRQAKQFKSTVFEEDDKSIWTGILLNHLSAKDVRNHPDVRVACQRYVEDHSVSKITYKTI